MHTKFGENVHECKYFGLILYVFILIRSSLIMIFFYKIMKLFM